MAGKIEECALKSNEAFLAALQFQKERLRQLLDEIESDSIDDQTIRDVVLELNVNLQKVQANCGNDVKSFIPFNFNFLML